MKNIGWSYLHTNETNEVEKPAEQGHGFPDMDMSGFGSMVFSPLGTFHERDPMNPNLHFKFWVGHTNFRITHEDVDNIRFTDGVEMFNIWTPYRFIVAFGEQFQSGEVKQAIEQNVQEAGSIDLHFNDEITMETFYFTKSEDMVQSEQLKDFYSQLDTTYKYWVSYTEDSGDDLLCTYYACNSDRSKDFRDTIETLVDAYEIHNSSQGVKDNAYYNIGSEV